MAIVIDRRLTASETEVNLPSDAFDLIQTLHSDLGGEPARITYSLDKRHNISFKTPSGLVKQIEVQAQIPGQPAQRRDSVTLALDGPSTSIEEVTITQVIQAENRVENSVTLNVES
jgi:hypothetical protein